MTQYIPGWIAAILVGLSKTGFPGASLPAIALVSSSFEQGPQKGILALLPVLLVADFVVVARFRKHAQWDLILKLLPAVVVGMIPGSLVLLYTEESILKPVIGWTILLIVILELARRSYQWNDRVPKSRWFANAMGGLAGFCTMVAHAAMPVMTRNSRRLNPLIAL